MGRSNVGKSSLLNALVQRRRLARTSQRPGKTQTINYYAVDRCYFVDLPGYGYAAVPIAVRQQWGPMIESYLSDNSHLAGVVSLIDSRRPPTPLDREMIAWLAGRGVPTLVVLTKADKVARGKRRPFLTEACNQLGLGDDQVVWFSARTGEGRDAVLDAVSRLLTLEA